MPASALTGISGRLGISLINHRGSVGMISGYNPELVTLVKNVPGRQWHKEERLWTVPADHFSTLTQMLNTAGFRFSDDTRGTFAKTMDLAQRTAKAFELADRVKNWPHIKNATTTLRRFQAQGAMWMVTVGNALLADDMGLGKTLQSLVAFGLVKHYKDSESKMLVATRKSVLSSWAAEIERRTDFTYKVVEGSKEQRRLCYHANVDIIIVGHDALTRDINAGIVPLTRFDVTCLDESTVIKNITTQRSKSLRKLVSKYKFALSGTPIENSLTELHAIFEWFRPGLLGTAWQFRQQYMVVNAFGKPINGQHMEQLRTIIGPYVLRRTKQEVAPEMPAKQMNDYWIDISDGERAEYDKLKRGFLDWMRDQETGGRINIQEAIVRILRMKQYLCHPSVVNSTQSGSKLTELESIVEQLGERRFIIFTQFSTVAHLIHEKIEGLAIITGESSQKTRELMKDGFLAGKFRGIVSTDALAYGTNGLQEVGDVIIHYDQLWNPAAMRQREDRLHRIGQSRTVDVITMMCKDTVDEYITELLNEKRELALQFFSGESTTNRAVNSRSMLLRVLGIAADEELDAA